MRVMHPQEKVDDGEGHEEYLDEGGAPENVALLEFDEPDEESRS